ncbi:MAG: hypothetical protein WC556_12750 [Candidatus Methanoperedens sp.]
MKYFKNKPRGKLIHRIRPALVISIIFAIIFIQNIQSQASDSVVPISVATAEKFRVVPTVRLSPVIDVIGANQDGIVELIMKNPSLNDVALNVELSISMDLGIHVYGESLGKAVGNSQVYGTFSVPPGTEKTIIAVIKADKSVNIGSHYLVFTGAYWPGSKKDDNQFISLTYTANVKEASNNPESSEFSTTSPIIESSSSNIYLGIGGFLAITAICIVVLYVRRRDPAPKPATEQHERVGSDILDAAYALSKKASSLFIKKDYDGALETYGEARDKFLMALNSAENDASLAKSIKSNIISSRKNILACKFALGIGISESAKNAFDKEKCEEAERLYNKAIEYFETSLIDAQELKDTDEIEKVQALISETKSNINSCYVTADKIKVEELSEQAGNLIKEAVKFREDMELSKARNNLKKAEGIIEEAFDIATKREFDEAQQILSRFLKNVREERNTVDDLQLKPIERVKVGKRDPSKVMSSKPDIKSSEGNMLHESAELEIKPNYKTLVNKDVQIIILVKNMSRYTINDVDVTLKFDESQFSIKDTQFKKLRNITKGGKKTVEYILTPIPACIPSTEINAIINFNDAENNSHTIHMQPMTLQCIAPNLAAKPMDEKEFVKLFENHKCQVKGIVFKGISEETVTDFIKSIKDRSTVKNILVNGIRIIYLSSEAKNKSFYLLTVIIRDEDDLTYVALKACSNNEAGINNSIDQVLDALRFYLSSVRSAREVENVTINKSIQIINSPGTVASLEGDAKGMDESFNYKSKR